MKILAVTGLIGSGKGEVARYIAKKYGFVLLDHSEVLGKLLRSMGRPTTREEKCKLRLERGNTFTAEMINKEIRKQNLGKVVIGSLRRPEEYEVSKKEFPELKLLVVESDPKIRFERQVKRDRDVPKGWDGFLAAEKLEEEVFNFTKTFSYADFVIKNNSTLGELHKKIDNVMQKAFKL